MAYTDLTALERQELDEFMRNYRAAIGDTVRGLRMQSLLNTSWTNSIAAIWAKCVNGDVIPDGAGLAGADHSMTKAEIQVILTWSANLLAALYAVNGGAVATVWPTRAAVDGYGVTMAGATNIG
jgi:hypothetical protein